MGLFYERLTAFLDEWLNIPKEMKNKDGLVCDDWSIKTCISYLIEGGVFTKEELRKEALKSHLIILPHNYFEVGA